jgi:hypothetical protein
MGGNSCGLFYSVIHKFALRDGGKPRRVSVKRDDTLTEIRTEYLPHMNLELCPYVDSFSGGSLLAFSCFVLSAASLMNHLTIYGLMVKSLPVLFI